MDLNIIDMQELVLAKQQSVLFDFNEISVLTFLIRVCNPLTLRLTGKHFMKLSPLLNLNN